MKRLCGWDAVLLYSETPNVHMHTLKLAVIELDELKGRRFGVEEFRKVIHGRLYKLEPFRYQLIDIPLQDPPPDVAGELRGRPRLPRAPVPRRQSRRPPPAGRGGRQDREHPAGPQQAAVGDVLHRGVGQRPHRGAGQDPSRAGRRRRVGQPAGSRDGPSGRAASRYATPMQPTRPRARASWCARHSPTTCGRSAGCPA